jgi:predicted O-methyltransferase YrrM
MLRRIISVYRYYKGPLRAGLSWSFKKTESFNFYYDLSELNLLYLKHFIAEIFNVSFSIVDSYFNEFLSNEALFNHLRSNLKSNPETKDSHPAFGRRIAWYVVARITKPKVILESGVFQGVGALVLVEALKLNQGEGFNGQYYGIDIDSNSGSFLKGFPFERASLIIGDSIEMLSQVGGEIDLYINDGDHNPTYEEKELVAIRQYLSPNAVLIADNAHVSPALAEWCIRFDMAFHFFCEKPKSHWYPGGGIGIGINRAIKRSQFPQSTDPA